MQSQPTGRYSAAQNFKLIKPPPPDMDRPPSPLRMPLPSSEHSMKAPETGRSPRNCRSLAESLRTTVTQMVRAGSKMRHVLFVLSLSGQTLMILCCCAASHLACMPPSHKQKSSDALLHKNAHRAKPNLSHPSHARLAPLQKRYSVASIKPTPMLRPL